MIKGEFSNGSTWEFVQSQVLPDDSKIVAVCGTFFYKEEIILVRNKRGREIPGGHREMGESPSDTLIREIEEEVGLNPHQYEYEYYGYRVVHNKKVMFNQALDQNYPTPYYMLHYMGYVKDIAFSPTGSDVTESKLILPELLTEQDSRACKLIKYIDQNRENF